MLLSGSRSMINTGSEGACLID